MNEYDKIRANLKTVRANLREESDTEKTSGEDDPREAEIGWSKTLGVPATASRSEKDADRGPGWVGVFGFDGSRK